MVEVTLMCAVVGEAGRAFGVKIEGSQQVWELAKAIKDASEDITVSAKKLQLSLAKQGDAWLPSNDPDVVAMRSGAIPERVQNLLKGQIDPAEEIADIFVPPPRKKEIHVLVQVPDHPSSKWELVDAHCPALLIDDSPLVRISTDYTLGSGLAANEGGGLLLYRRSQLIEEWQSIQTCVCNTYAELWIVGPPGTGKSSAAFAFACSLDRTDWDVVWIHCPKRGVGQLQCIRFCGANDKWTCEIFPRELESLLKSLQERTVVFVDGYTNKKTSGGIIETACVEWREVQKMYHRLVWVSSMVSLGKNYYPTQYAIIPTAVDATTLKTNAIFDTPAPQAEIKDAELFELMSWTLEDYEMVMANDEFFEHVKTKFTDTKEPVLWEERKQLLEDKFFVVGGSARYMFDSSVEKAVVELDKAIDATDNIEEYVKNTRGISSEGAVNRLFSWYRVGDNAKSCLLSQHVARKLAQMLGPDFVQNISTSLSSNPSMDGHLFELWFFAKLTHGGVQCLNIAQDGEIILRDTWEAEKVPYFDPDGRIPMNQAKQWLAPQKWNQGGYDAVFVELLDDDERHLVGAQAMRVRVRFVQVTRADKHSFKEQFFETLLTKLTDSLRGYRFEAVEVYFAVPIMKLATFKPNVDLLQVKKDVLEPAGLRAETTSVAVEIVGLSYKEFREGDDLKRLKRFKSG